MIRAALVVGSVLGALLLVEVAVRVFALDPAAHPIRPSAPSMPVATPWLRSLGPALGGRGVVDIRNNSLGLRDWEHPRTEDKRVLGIGDSFTFGYGVELDESYLSAAEQALWDAEPRAHVGFHKVGFSGTSQQVELEVLKQRWAAIEPNVVVLGFSEDTDIDENVVQDPRLRRVLKDRSLVDAPPAALAHDFLYRHSALVRYLKTRRLRDQVARDVRAFEQAIESRGGFDVGFDKLVRSSWQRRFIGAFGDKLEGEWHITEGLLDQMRGFVEARGRKFVLFRIPSRTALIPAQWDAAVRGACGKTARDVSATCGHVDPDHTAKRLARYAARHGLSYVDPAEELKSFIAAGEPIYFAPPEIHWTRQGHYRAGRMLASALAGLLGVSKPAVAEAVQKKRTFGAFWSPPSKGAPRPSSWIGALEGDAQREASQVTLWAEQARLDFLVLGVKPAADGEASPDFDAETQTMMQRIVAQRRDRVGELAFALALPMPSAGAPESRKQILDALLARHVDSAGGAYARACGRPLLFVDPRDDLQDERFAIVRASPAAASESADAACAQRKAFSADANCAELREVQWLCVQAAVDGRSFAADPDLLLAASFNGPGPSRIEPAPDDGRLRVALVSDAVRRWKSGVRQPRRPAATFLTFVREWLPVRGDPAPLDRKIEFTSASAFCMGCRPLEDSDVGSFAWTVDKAVLGIRGLTPGKRYTVTLDIANPGPRSHGLFGIGDGAREDLELRAGETPLPYPLAADGRGTLRWLLRVDAWQPSRAAPGSTDDRWLGVAIRSIRVRDAT